MADLSDVLDAIYAIVNQIVYPNGLNNPSVAGVGVNIVEGWPVRNKLDDQLKAGKAMISIFPKKERVLKAFFRKWQTVSIAPPTITAVVLNNTITIGGTVYSPQAVAAIVNYVGYSYGVLSSDTLQSIAFGLAELIPSATANGTVITINNHVFDLQTRISTQAIAAQRLSRQEREFVISCWCPSPSIRKILSPPIDIYFKQFFHLPLNDGFIALVSYSHTDEIDDLQMPYIYRRDIVFKVQYETTVSANYMTMTVPTVSTDIRI